MRLVELLPRDAMLARYVLWAWVCLCMSVRSRRSTKTAKSRIMLMQRRRHDSLKESIFLMPKISAKCYWVRES